ncbi:MAG: NYN domain-containing protein [Euryarchaeota archaeon]|nr:NYN domain-containing protein [Euryarchaeota archaeon]
MIFIDGGYLRESFKKLFGHDRIQYGFLSRRLFEKVSGSITGGATGTAGLQLELRRVYYYDAIVTPKEEEFDQQNKYFAAIEENPDYEVKLGRLIRLGDGGFRQKGVDILLAIDMINKAHLNHYDIALLLAGDDDYLDLVKTVKDISGKRVFGAYDTSSASKRLIKSFDRRIELTELPKDILEQP